MRWLALTLCLISAGCSYLYDSTPPMEAEPPPDTAVALAGLKATATEAKLVEPLEVSQVMETPENFTQRWMICIRSGVSEGVQKADLLSLVQQKCLQLVAADRHY